MSIFQIGADKFGESLNILLRHISKLWEYIEGIIPTIQNGRPGFLSKLEIMGLPSIEIHAEVANEVK